MSFDSFIEECEGLGKEQELWTGTLKDYLELVAKNPQLAMSAHKRMLKMIESHGMEKDSDGNITSYNFFKNELFGIDSVIQELMEYLRAAASGSEVSRRILLLYGPTSSGKSQLAIMLKKGLEKFSKTEEGAVYCLSDSPMWEDPLWAVPEELRESFQKQYGIAISGQLSPYTQKIVDEKYSDTKGAFLKMPVRRFFFSEKGRAGIGTFVPSDKKSQDISELVGSIDLSKIAEYGTESDPRAYKFDGELNIANRGMMEFVEMLKVDQKFLYVLLTLAQEKNIKTARFPLIYADEVLLSHTNESEYKRFLAKDEMEALHDRMIVVRAPYNLTVNEEIKIYDKLIKQSELSTTHIAPHTLHCAAMFAVLSRLFDSNHKGLTLLNKMRLYNGEEVEGFTKTEITKFKSEFPDEGMQGLSPRYVINRIATTIADGDSFISPIDIIRSLRDGLKSNPKIDKKESERLENLLTYVIEEYNKLARNDVQKAFFVNFEDEIVALLGNYLEHVESFLDGKKIIDEWGTHREPDERLMRSVEDKIGITESGKRSFREEIYRKMLRSGATYKDHTKLREALEKKLFDERQDIIRLTVSKRNPDEEALKKVNSVIEILCDKYGYTASSANELLKYVSSLMARG